MSASSRNQTGITITDGKMLPRRNPKADGIYLITFVTAQRANLFDELLLARIVVRQLRAQPYATTLAYVIMPDHVHWLLRLQNNGSLAAVVRNAKSSSAVRINKFYGRSGRVWQKGFQDHAIREEDDLKFVARHIITNPVRAGLAKSVREYSHWDAIWF